MLYRTVGLVEAVRVNRLLPVVDCTDNTYVGNCSASVVRVLLDLHSRDVLNCVELAVLT